MDGYGIGSPHDGYDLKDSKIEDFSVALLILLIGFLFSNTKLNFIVKEVYDNFPILIKNRSLYHSLQLLINKTPGSPLYRQIIMWKQRAFI